MRRLARNALFVLLPVLGLVFGWRVWTQLAYEARLAQLAALAIPKGSARRPWEVRFEALAARMSGRSDFPADGPRPQQAWSDGARDLDVGEERWLARTDAALEGLDRVLAELRGLDLESLSWNGETCRLLFLRECVNVLAGRAWRERDASILTDALRFARATDDGTMIASAIRMACEQIVLDCARTGVTSARFEARVVRAELAPQLADWIHSPEAAQRRIRRDLASLGQYVIDGLDLVPDEVGWLARPVHQRKVLRALAPLEEALSVARGPLASTPWVSPQGTYAGFFDEPGFRPLSSWCHGTFASHSRHSRRNVFLTGLAVATFHEENGRWPAHLEQVSDLAPEDALDPMTRAPLVYVASPEGALVGPAGWGLDPDRWEDPVLSPYAWDLGAR